VLLVLARAYGENGALEILEQASRDGVLAGTLARAAC